MKTITKEIMSQRIAVGQHLNSRQRTGGSAEMKVIALVGARMGSTRFPGKVLKPLGYTTVLGWVVRAAHAATLVDEIWACTTTERRDNAIEQWCNDNAIHWWRGSETDVLRRLADCARHAQADIVVRLTGDCPFLDPCVIDEVIMLQRLTGVAYANNTEPPSFPDGLDVQCFAAEALYAADKEATSSVDRDCVGDWVSRHRERFPSAVLVSGIPSLERERWVLDCAEDYEFCKTIVAEIGDNEPASMIRILDVLQRKPELRKINSIWKRNERFWAAVAENPV